MRRTVSLLLSILAVVCLCSCINGAKQKNDDPRENLRSEVESYVELYITLSYETTWQKATVTKIEEDGDYYTVYGKVNIRDNYGDNYFATFDGKYRLIDDQFQKQYLNIEEPIKNY